MAEKSKPTNNLAPDRKPDYSTINHLASWVGHPSGSREHVKAYMYQFIGTDPGDYDEKHLSPAGIETIRQLAARNYGKFPDKYQDFVSIGDYPPDDPTLMNFAMGAIAPSNIRKVDIGGVPYWQVLDRYDFNGVEDDLKTGNQNHLLGNVVKGLLRGDPNPEEIPGALGGLAYNMNFLVPVDPKRSAHPDLVEAYRRQSSLGNNPAFPTNTLPNRVGNALRNAATPKRPNEKAMP